MVLPPQMTQEELEELMNVVAPAMPTGGVAGSDITYFKRPENIAYSMDNLPLWMQDFKQVSPTTYAPDQGVFNAAPIIESIQATMPQDYIEQYQPLEQAYQESLGIDPTWFGGEYRSGIYMPTQTMPERANEGSFDIAEALAASEALKKLYPYAEKTAKAVYDPVEEFVQQNVLEPTEEAIQQKVLDPSEDAFKVVADPIEEGVQQAILDPIEDIAKIPLKAADEVLGVTDKLESVKETIIDPLVEKIKINEEERPDGQDSIFDGIKNAAEVAAKAVAETENMIKNPLGQSSEDAVNAINELGDLAGVGGEDGRVIPPVVAEGLVVAGNLAAMSKAFEDPSAANLANGYAAADDLVMNYTEAGGLPAGESIGDIGTVLTGIKVLEEGVNSPADAIAVAKATQTIGSLTGSTATFDIGASMSNFLAPIGVMTTAMAVMDTVSSLWQGSAAGRYPNSSGSVSFANGQFTAGGFSGGDGADSNWGKAASEASASILNSFVRDGFVVDEAKAQQVLSSGVGNIASNSYYSSKNNRSANPQEVIYELMKSGAITPTENTPERIIKSNESFNKYIKGKLNSAQNSMANRILNATEGKVSKSPPVPFTSSFAAQSYIDRYGEKKTTGVYGNSLQTAITSFELGKEIDGNQFLNKSILTINGDSTTGVISKFDEFGKRFGPQETVPTKYIHRFNETKNPMGYYEYNPRYDKDPNLYDKYDEYMRNSLYGGYHYPSIMGKQSGTSAYGKDAKLYMSQSDWEKTFTGSF